MSKENGRGAKVLIIVTHSNRVSRLWRTHHPCLLIARLELLNETALSRDRSYYISICEHVNGRS